MEAVNGPDLQLVLDQRGFLGTECVLLLESVFSYARRCSLTEEGVL
jgi:hypothetical protein